MKLKMPKLRRPSKKAVIITSVTVAAVVGVIVVLYFTNRDFRRKIDGLLKITDKKLGPIVDRADTVTFEIPEDRVPPNTQFVLTGQFKDNEGNPVRVKEAYYYVIQNASGDTGPRELLIEGSIGTNVGKFSHTVKTTGFPRGDDYDVIVSDHPLSVSDIQGTGTNSGGPGLNTARGQGQGEGGIPLGIGDSDQVTKQSMLGGVGGLI